MVSCGITKRFPIDRDGRLMQGSEFCIPLNPLMAIPRVVFRVLLIFISVFLISIIVICVKSNSDHYFVIIIYFIKSKKCFYSFDW